MTAKKKRAKEEQLMTKEDILLQEESSQDADMDQIIPNPVATDEEVVADLIDDTTTTTVEKERLTEQIETLQQQVMDHKDVALRAQAEMENIKRRAERDVERAHKFALERLAKELLPVVDSLEKSIVDDDSSVHEGVEMTLSLLLKTLENTSITAVNPEQQAFNPDLHEAISMQEQADCEPNTVIKVLQKGYLLHDRLLRPALVIVAK